MLRVREQVVRGRGEHSKLGQGVSAGLDPCLLHLGVCEDLVVLFQLLRGRNHTNDIFLINTKCVLPKGNFSIFRAPPTSVSTCTKEVCLGGEKFVPLKNQRILGIK